MEKQKVVAVKVFLMICVLQLSLSIAEFHQQRNISGNSVNISYPHDHNYKGDCNPLPSSFFLITSFNLLSSTTFFFFFFGHSYITAQLRRTLIIELGAVQNSNYANLTHADTVLNF